MSKPALSIIIPTFNEERFIGRQLVELRNHTRKLPVEIIVVDNGSRDRSMEIARQAGADIVIAEEGTVAAVRNAGARRASADVLVFLDADVFPTAAWAERLGAIVDHLRQSPRTMTGSWVSVPQDCSWIERYWFRPLEQRQNSHINSGHMIISAELFKELGGFDPSLKTGEDFDISMRARAAGAKIIDDKSLIVIHEGYPKVLREFVRREIWHGLGDCQSLRGFLGSKVAVLGFLLLHMQVVGWALSLLRQDLLWGGSATGVALAASLAASLHRYQGADLPTRITTTFLYFCYFVARGISPYARGLTVRGQMRASQVRT